MRLIEGGTSVEDSSWIGMMGGALQPRSVLEPVVEHGRNLRGLPRVSKALCLHDIVPESAQRRTGHAGSLTLNR
jgi:hypothetical protein